MRSSVDLPHPDGPTRTQNSPSAMSSDSSSTALTPFGYTFVTSSSEIPLIERSFRTGFLDAVSDSQESNRRVRRVSSSHRASISSSVSVADVFGSSSAAIRMWSGPLLEHRANGQLDDVRIGAVQRSELRRIVEHLRRAQAVALDDARHLDARRPPAARDQARVRDVAVDHARLPGDHRVDDRRRVLARARRAASPRRAQARSFTRSNSTRFSSLRRMYSPTGMR